MRINDYHRIQRAHYATSVICPVFKANRHYVQVQNREQISHLIGASLALFMTGISISPAVAGLFKDVFSTFFMALAIFGFTFVYLVIFVRFDTSDIYQSNRGPAEITTTFPEILKKEWRPWNILLSLQRTILSPLAPFQEKHVTLFSGIALLLYNMTHSYIFSLIMVHTSIYFGFTSKENGWILSIVHIVSACYLFIVLFGISRMTSQYRSQRDTKPPSSRSSFILANRHALLTIISITMQAIALLGFANATKAWEIYSLSALVALGLATPSFMKSHFLGFFSPADATRAMAALTMMETFGSLLSPLFLGVWQTIWPNHAVFYGALGLMFVTLCFFLGSAFTQNNGWRWHNDDEN